jgi:hypothetical protein
MKNHVDLTGFLVMVLLTLLWGVNYPAVKIAGLFLAFMGAYLVFWGKPKTWNASMLVGWNFKSLNCNQPLPTTCW